MTRPGPKTPAPCHRVTVTLDDETKRKAREIGKGNVSAGIRESVEHLYAVSKERRLWELKRK